MGPHRDLVGDLAKAVRAEGLHLGASSHRVEHNFFLGVGREFRSDINDPKYAAFYGPAHTWLENKRHTPLGNDFTYVSPEWTHDWLARSAEIIQKYHPDVLFFDWWIGQPSVRADLTRFTAFYYNYSLKNGGPVGVITYKDYAMQEDSAVLDIERGQLAGIRPQYWQTDTSVSNKSWGYIENDTFKTPQFIVHQLVDVVSKNGNLLLNIGPALRWDDPGRSAAGAARRGFVAEGERRCDLRHSSVEEFSEKDRPRSRKVHFTTPTHGRTRPKISASPPRAMFSMPSNWAGRRSLRRSFTRLELEWRASGPVESVELLGSDAKVSFQQQKPDGLAHPASGTGSRQVCATHFEIRFVGGK